MKSILKTLAVLGLGCALSFSAKAVTFNLYGADATWSGSVSGSPHSAWYEAAPGGDSGTQAGIFTSLFGGDDTGGYWVKISFNGPQPELTWAGLKAGNDQLIWDSADLAGFNAGVYDSITLWQDVIQNRNEKYLGISHAALDGTPGTNVPDGGTTAVLLGLGLMLVGFVARRR